MIGIRGIGATFLDIRTAVKLPDALRGEKYAFVGLPLSEFIQGGGVSIENVGVGPVDLICRAPYDRDIGPKIADW